jgi:hypothetical protein
MLIWGTLHKLTVTGAYILPSGQETYTAVSMGSGHSQRLPGGVEEVWQWL